MYVYIFLDTHIQVYIHISLHTSFVLCFAADYLLLAMSLKKKLIVKAGACVPNVVDINTYAHTYIGMLAIDVKRSRK